MKGKLLIFVILFSFCSSLKAQMVYLPDTAWRNFLITQGLSTCISGDSLDVGCPAILGITSLDCNSKNIFDVSGINYFNNLSEFYCSNNNLTSLSNLPSSLLILNCGKNNISSLDSLPQSLTYLNCTENNLIHLDSLPHSIEIIDCSINQIISIHSTFDSLRVLNCSRNQIEFFTDIPLASTLTALNINHNRFTGSFNPPTNLNYLDFEYNQISFLGIVPPSLITLNCSANYLNDLPLLPSTLTTLTCTANNLSVLPPLPANLEVLIASYNLLTNIPTIPFSLRALYLSNNQLSILPNLPDSLIHLKIGKNQFSQLPILPTELIILEVNDNFISIINSLPNKLKVLNADRCQLSSLPLIPSTLTQLTVDSNNIQFINSLPDSMYILKLSNNPISCLPALHYAGTINLTNTNINCLPERLQYEYSDIDPDTLPLCDINSGCVLNWNIRGHINHDLNLDCSHDSTENFLKEIPVILKSNGIVRQVSYSTRYGEYSFKAPFGNYFVQVDTSSEPFNYNCPVGGYSSISISAADSIVDSLDFHLKCRPIDDKLVKSISPYEAFRPGRPTRVDINAGDASTYHGTTCFNNAGTIYAILSPNVTYTGPAANALPPTSINGDTLIWNIADFSTVVPSRDFNLQLVTDTTAAIGDSICIQVLILPLNDYDSTNNMIQECFPVRTSFDPNEKWVSPEVADTSDHTFTYTILFQNTGNAPAYNIFIIDTIDTDLNASTFELLGSSHDMTTQIFPGNIIRFNFNAIELPDSVNDEPNSHGFVKYRINKKASTGAGTEITNTAFIYFDYNSPIATNTTRVEINSPVGITDPLYNKIELYPNPANNSITITSDKRMSEIQIHDIYGKIVFSKLSVNSNDIHLSLNELKPGLYFVKITSLTNKQTVKKLIIH